MLYKNTLIKIKKSFGRYISLLIIVMLGVGFFAGVDITSPDIINVADNYYKEHKLMDFKIVSTMGLTDADVRALTQIEGVEDAIPSYSLDLSSEGGVIRFHAIEDEVNKVKLIEGKMPTSDDECVADSRKYSLGDIIEISDGADGKIKNTRFTVSGLVESVLYLHDDYGNTTMGNGKLASFIFIPKDNFTLKAYTEIYIIAETNNALAYSSEYKLLSQKLNDEFVRIKPERESIRYEEINSEAMRVIEENVFNAGMLSRFQEYYEGMTNQSADNAENEDNNTKTLLPNIEHPKWYILDRSAAIGYAELDSSIKVVSTISAVLPFFFILISMLMTSNSMARMITEERGELGALASLGYKDGSIVFTYILYVLSATWLGAITGFFLGCGFIPRLIYSNFTFRLPPLILMYNPLNLALDLIIASLLMSFVTIFACNRELRQMPAYLMRPLPPKRGQRILLEKVGFVWKRLSFTWKVTLRNMFRYKKRAFMTVIGIAGCTALLLIAFGLRDSMNGIAQKQYGSILRYDSMILLKDEVSSISDDLMEILKNEQIVDPLLIKHSSYKCDENGIILDFYIVVPQNTELFDKYYSLSSTLSRNKIGINDGDIIITQRIAKVYDLKKGDSFTVTDADNNSYVLYVSDIAENYASNYVYMNMSVYNKMFGGEASFNAIVSNLNTDETDLAERLIDSGISAVVFTEDMTQSVFENTQRLNGIIVLILFVASLLAIVVLYNLTAINISERTREIATLKVLGFRDVETNAYIYREAAILTMLSIGIGLLAGIALHHFMLDVIETGALSLSKQIKGFSFILSCILTMVFSFFMQIVTYFKLKKIDMIESLKSIE